MLDVVTSFVLILAGTAVLYDYASSEQSGTVEVPSTPVSVDGAPSRGSADAGVVMIVYADFQCPHCARFTRQVLPDLDRRYIATGRVALVFRHLPLPIHPQAVQAAAVAECSGQQGQFWEMHDLLFAAQTLDDETLRSLPEAIDLDKKDFDACLRDESTGDRIQASIDEANGFRIRSTPVFLFGKRLDDGRVRVSSALSGARALDHFVELLDATLAGKTSGWRSWVPWTRRATS